MAVRDGRQGLAKAAAIRPDLIVLDVMMPGEGGALMYKALKADAQLRHIPVIMCSAVSRESFQHFLNMLNSQADFRVPDPDGYVEKPPDPEALLGMVQRMLTPKVEDSGPSGSL